MIMSGATAKTGAAARQVEILNAKQIDISVCEKSSLVENLWLVDGTVEGLKSSLETN